MFSKVPVFNSFISTQEKTIISRYLAILVKNNKSYEKERENLKAVNSNHTNPFGKSYLIIHNIITSKVLLKSKE